MDKIVAILALLGLGVLFSVVGWWVNRQLSKISGQLPEKGGKYSTPATGVEWQTKK